MTKVYTGWVVFVSNGEEDEILSLVSDKHDYDTSPYENSPLSEIIGEHIEEFGSYLSVRYYVSDQKIDTAQLPELFMAQYYGEGEADYSIAYTEITGYLWTNDDIEIGGHNLRDELESHLGKWLYMEIDYNKKPASE